MGKPSVQPSAMIELLYVTGVIEIEKLGVQGTRHIMAAQGKVKLDAINIHQAFLPRNGLVARAACDT